MRATASSPNLALSPIVETFVSLAHEAGCAIMTIYESGASVTVKADSSPVTDADRLAEDIILRGLATALPDIPVVSEEAAADGHVPATADRFILVDPLDGTKEFLNRNGEFTVNIALVQDGEPVAGVVYAPAVNRMAWGEAGIGAAEAAIGIDDRPARAAWRPIATRPQPEDGLTVVASRSHRDAATEAYLETVSVAELVSAGSSLKFCLIAAGEADLYPRMGRTMEWDTAAGHAVLAAAGGSVVREDGTPLTYGKREAGFANPPFIARGWR